MFVPDFDGTGTPTPASSGGGTPAPAPTPTPASSAPATPAAPKATGLDRLRQMTPKAADAPAPVADKAAADPAPLPPGTTTTPPVGAEPPAWDPAKANWKFKVMDKEHEIPEWIRSAAQSPEHEKYLREMHEKSLGLDVVKPRLAESQKQLKQIMPEFQKFQASKQELINHYQRGDMDSFFNTIGVSEEKVLQWAVKKAQLLSLPPEQQQAYEAHTAAERRAYQLEQQLQQATSQNAATSAQVRQHQLQVELAKPDVLALAKAFDEAAGKPQAFFEAIVEIGENAWYRDKTDLSPEQAVQIAMARYGKFVKPQAAIPAADPQVAAQPGLIPPAPAPGRERAPNGQFITQPPGGQQAPTIPNVGARSGSPVVSGKKVRSIQDLKDISKERFGR